MPQFYTNPNITYAGLREPESVSDLLMRFAQLQQMADSRRYNKLREKEALLQLRELERGTAEQEARRRATAAGVRRIPPIPSVEATAPGLEGILGPTRPGPSSPAGVEFDPQATLAALSQPETAHLVPGMQQQFAGQAATAQEQRLKLTEQITKLDTEQLKNLKSRANMLGSLAQSVKLNPNSYPQAKAMAEQLGIQPGILPEQFTPELLPQLDAWITQARDVEDIAKAEETKRHNEAIETERAKPQPGVDVPFPAAVAAQKKEIAKAGRETMGLSPQQTSRVTSLASQFDSNPVVKNYNEQVNRVQGVEQILAGGWSGPGDMATVFEFMKALDPTSVVREAEYATAAKTGNIFKGWAARFNGLINESGGFLSEQVKKDFADILKKKVAVSTEQVKRLHGDFARRIDKITGRADGADYLTDYSTLYEQSGSKPARLVNGVWVDATTGKPI